ncbi:MAG: rRNA maturation RNase YbeY [Methylococcales bacterium]|nr:rRNA maturation RNase YbeY [Methylococcales bacterium]
MTQIDLQIASTAKNLPTEMHFQTWVDNVLNDSSELVIRLVDVSESAELNQRYRHKQGATNILSFPFEAPEMVTTSLLGDLVICVPLIEQQALQQHKPLLNHWAHIVIHGTLHLCGYDHENKADADEMETKEINLLKKLSIPNPYQEHTPL